MIYILAFMMSMGFALVHDLSYREIRASSKPHSSRIVRLLERCSITFSALTLIVLSGLRSGVGVDQALYTREFLLIAEGSDWYIHSDYGFQILNRAIAAISSDPVLLYLILSAIFIIGAYSFALKFGDKLAYFVLLLFVTFNYFQSLSLIAQYTAIGFICLSLGSLIDERYIKSGIWLILAIACHSSAAVFIPIVLWYWIIRRSDRPLGACQAMMAIVAVAVLLIGFLAPIILRGTRFYVYLYSRDDSNLNSGSLVVINIIVWLYYTYIIIKYKSARTNKTLLLLYLLQFIALALSLAQGQVNLLVRLAMYFTFFQVVSIPLFGSYLSKNYRVLFNTAIIFAFSAWVLYFPLSNNYYNILPYTSVFERPLY